MQLGLPELQGLVLALQQHVDIVLYCLTLSTKATDRQVPRYLRGLVMSFDPEGVIRGNLRSFAFAMVK